jgi:Tol biopolymer transport system component
LQPHLIDDQWRNGNNNVGVPSTLSRNLTEMERNRNMKYNIFLFKFSCPVILFIALSPEIPAVPPIGTKIAFVSRRTGNNQIFVMNPDGSDQINVSNSQTYDDSPSWSPNGSKIAFARCDAGNDCQIYTMNADGSNQVSLTSGDDPDWSPDGTKIAFTCGSDICVINTDGTNLIGFSRSGLDYGPEFSPDGSRIVFGCARRCNCIPDTVNEEICVMNGDGSNEINLTNNPYEDILPALSPDGSRIAFFSYRPTNSCCTIVVMNSNGSDQTVIANNMADLPAWSPDGTKIAFRRDGDIWVMDPDGTAQTRITTDPAMDYSPSWQRVPGNAVPFDFDGDGRTDLSVFRDGTWFVNQSHLGDPSSFYGVQFGLQDDKLAPADFDGDGKIDIAVWRENVNGSFGYFFILLSSTNTVRTFQFGQAGDDPGVVGDWDGDGIADIAVYRNGTAAGEQSYFYFRLSSDPLNELVAVPWGTFGDEPLRGDFDGDGRMDASVFRPSDGVWYILQSSNAQPRYAYSGVPSDKRVSGDFDGDGKTDLAIFHEGLWAVLQSSNNQDLYRWWGLPTDTLVPGDYDGDGRTDFAVWRDGIYYIMQSSNSQPAYYPFGLPQDIPVASAFGR